MVPVYPGGQQWVQWTTNTSTNAQVAFLLAQKRQLMYSLNHKEEEESPKLKNKFNSKGMSYGFGPLAEDYLRAQMPVEQEELELKG